MIRGGCCWQEMMQHRTETKTRLIFWVFFFLRKFPGDVEKGGKALSNSGIWINEVKADEQLRLQACLFRIHLEVDRTHSWQLLYNWSETQNKDCWLGLFWNAFFLNYGGEAWNHSPCCSLKTHLNVCVFMLNPFTNGKLFTNVYIFRFLQSTTAC